MSTHELVFRHKRIASSSCVSTGLTVVEVLFAMVIILVGLIGVAAMIPFAGRQAEDSYKITQAGAAGESALGVFNSSSIVRPRMDSPWLFISDQGNRSPVASLNEFYLSEFVSRSSPPNSSPSTPLQVAILQNQVIGMGFCIDPLFWGYQTNFVGSGNFAKTRFPFYNDFMPANYDPLGSPASFSTPRLRRVSLFDPSSSYASPRWLRLPSAIQLATVSGGDLIQAKAEVDKSAAPLRGEYVDGTGALLQSPTASASVSWIATLTPIDETPVILPEMLAGASTTGPALAPENYNLGVVVFSKRDVRDFNLDPTSGIPATGEVPISERLGFLNDVAGTPNHLSATWNAGTFDILIEADSKVDPKIKIGDWLMLSRNTSVEVVVNPPVAPPVLATRQRHKWYRVIGVSGDNAFPREVRVAGEPWYWTKHERQIFIKYGVSTLPTMPVTAVTLLKNVLQVYERTVNLNMN